MVHETINYKLLAIKILYCIFYYGIGNFEIGTGNFEVGIGNFEILKS